MIKYLLLGIFLLVASVGPLTLMVLSDPIFQQEMEEDHLRKLAKQNKKKLRDKVQSSEKTQEES